MTEILFYHLETQPLDKVLPVLVERSLERGWRVVVETGDEASLPTLDDLLWTYRPESFLPHGVAGSAQDARQPVLLTASADNANGATVRFFVHRAVPRGGEGYERLVYLFSGHDPEAMTEARAAWRALASGNTLTYWQQDPSGRWAKKG